jgi:hypothetical protein
MTRPDTRVVTDLGTLLAEGRTFGTIYADPPWRYNKTVGRGAAAKHYDTMTVEEICALPVDRLAAPDAHLYLWVTTAFLFDGLTRIVPAWGFEFLGTFVWYKPTMGTGNYYRNAHELMLICTRPGAPPPADEMPGGVLVKRGRHAPSRNRSAESSRPTRRGRTWNCSGGRRHWAGRSSGTRSTAACCSTTSPTERPRWRRAGDGAEVAAE